jgi:hypothetical protein
MPNRHMPPHSVLLLLTALACSEGRRAVNVRQDSVQDTASNSASNARSESLASPRQASTTAQFCVDARGPIQISEDSVGTLALDAALRQLRESCPTASDTRHYAETEDYAALVFPFPGLSATAVQWRDSLQPDMPADSWIVEGTNGVLPNGVPMTAPWAALRRAYGTGLVARGEVALTAMCCAHRRLFFILRASPETMENGGPDPDLSLVPDSTRIRNVSIARQPELGWRC